MQLKNKIALVTGSTTGIGEEIARRFAKEGARVMIHGRRQNEAEEVIASIKEAGGEAAYHLARLDEPNECASIVEATVEQFGGLDILVNNAAVMTRSNLETTDVETFDFTIAVNLRAPMLLCQAALPHFRKAGQGVILNIGSINAYTGEGNQLAYSMSKGGLMTMSRNLADAHARENIRVNHLNLGWVLTPNEYKLKMTEGLDENWPENVPPAFAPSGHILSPKEIAHFALAFVSDEGAPISGAVVELEQYPMIGRNPMKD